MFDAPLVYRQIPDLRIIYDYNDRQTDELYAAYDAVDDSIFLDRMGEHTIARWEKVLGIIPLSSDTLQVRRFRVKTKLMERLPYSYRVIVGRLRSLFGDDFVLRLNEARTEFALFIDPSMSDLLPAAYEMLDMMLPLNMTLRLNAEGDDIRAKVYVAGAVSVAVEIDLDGTINRPVAVPTPVYFGMAMTVNSVREV